MLKQTGKATLINYLKSLFKLLESRLLKELFYTYNFPIANL
jgi:hypothetical protein